MEGNVVLTGNLVCFGNVPARTNSDPGGTFPNTVVLGDKLGQCAAL